ncbi:putative sporulation protein YtxC [Cohnella phaseoli]|uniref:Putative sporulation protein YtxC n=1 Tax=Cohnella phaseoli TaxID=456490 RepID=A0A3D9IXP8_9BACL|nr:putative sporulation protein YtxC [Cohnella phaseoli]RED66495.1 putative sporulation protein YtxC [Cohnella phaseoli]
MKKKMKFVVAYASDPPSLERLAGMLSRTFVDADAPVDSVLWELSQEDGVIRCQFPIGPGPQGKKKSCDRVGKVLAEYTLSEQEPSLLRKLFRSKFSLSDAMELDAMIAEAVALLDGEPEADSGWMGRGRERRRQKLADKFSQYLAEHERLNLEGFLRFRLSDYRAEVLEAAEAAIEERMMERQYQEFMALLKSMVERQESRTPTVHVLHSGGHAFRLLDEELRPLGEADEVEPESLGRSNSGGKESLEETEEEESLLVSRLLVASPRQLYIHTPEPEAQVIRTIIGIFGDRASLYPDLPVH